MKTIYRVKQAVYEIQNICIIRKIFYTIHSSANSLFSNSHLMNLESECNAMYLSQSLALTSHELPIKPERKS